MSEKEWEVNELLKKAVVHHINKEFKKAIECCEKVLEIDTNNAEAYYKLGMNYTELENYSEALKCYEKTLAINPKDNLALGKMNQLKKITKSPEELISEMAEGTIIKEIKFRAEGLFARVIQYEVDHLDGILITDK